MTTAALLGRSRWAQPWRRAGPTSTPKVFNPFVSFQTVIMALLGGVGSVAGPVVGAVFLGLASELLLLKFRYVYMLGLGLTLIVVVLALPSGLIELWAQVRHRH